MKGPRVIFQSLFAVVGPHLVTEDPQECIDFIGSLVPYGGGDCPELANSGLEIALVNR